MTDPDSSVRDLEWEESYDPRSEYQTDMTIRDLVWDATMELLGERVLFTNGWVREKAGLVGGQSRTVRRVLNSMEELGWVARPESMGGYYWTAGDKAREHLDVVSPKYITEEGHD